MSVNANEVAPGRRCKVIAAAPAEVTRELASASPVVHQLPQGTIVVCAEVAGAPDGRQRARISSPAGWVDAHALAPAASVPSFKLDFETFESNHLKIGAGDNYGLEFPFTADQLREFGAEFLTLAFRAAGTIAADNSVEEIVAIEPLSTKGASESAFITAAYARPEPGLSTSLFVKFPPDKGLEFKYDLTAMSHFEVAMQRLARRAGLPMATAEYYYGDYCSATSNYILITDRINYGVPPIEPAHRKGYDHLIPEVEEHYLVMTRALASLVAAHKSGSLGLDVEEAFPFARAARDFDPIASAVVNVDRLVDFVGRVAPQLFVAEGTSAAFLRQWREDLLFGLTHKDAVIAHLHADVDYTGLCHPNLNLDNAWFWRDDAGELQVGLIDWGGAGQMSIAQALSGMLMMPIPESYLGLQRRVIATFIDGYAKRGGLALDAATLHFQYKASVFSTAICTIVAHVVPMLFQFSDEEYRSMKYRSDQRLLDNGIYAAIVWIDNMLRDWLDDDTPGDACRRIVAQSLPAPAPASPVALAASAD